MTTRASLRGLDWLNFFVANLQTGFGQFIAVYLTINKWTQAEIGLALSVGTIVSVVAQVPAGALVDATRRKRLAAGVALLAIGLSAATLGIWPARLPVTLAEAAHGLASCVLGPAIAAITLRMVPPDGLAERFGRNARYLAAGSAVGAALMGATGLFVSSRAVFWLAALLCVPALMALRGLSGAAVAVPVPPPPAPAGPRRAGWRALLDPRLTAFGVCTVLFHLSNAAMLPIAASEVTRQAGDMATGIIAACIVVPQLVTAAISPWVGRMAERRGRRAMLLLGFAALPARALMLAAVTSPASVVVAQLFDGVGAACFGLMVPLVAADLTRASGRFNTAVGAIGLAVGLGATLSTTLGGQAATLWSPQAAFLLLGAAGAAAFLAVALLMPETRPEAMPASRFTPPPRVRTGPALARRPSRSSLVAVQHRHMPRRRR